MLMKKKALYNTVYLALCLQFSATPGKSWCLELFGKGEKQGGLRGQSQSLSLAGSVVAEPARGTCDVSVRFLIIFF